MEFPKPTGSPLSPFDRLYIRFFYFLRSLKYDLPENKVGWRSRQNQELRFQALARIGDLDGQSILDLGCGLGCLYGYLKGRGWQGTYTGFDILDRMVVGARKRYPGVRFEKRDMLRNQPDEKWDYVFVNGVFNHKVKDNWAWIEEGVRRSLAVARKGMAFTILNGELSFMDKDLFYTDPTELEKRVKEWSGGKYKIAKDYMPEDMAAYLYKT